MSTHKIQFVAKPWASSQAASTASKPADIHIESGTCTEAETFSLRILDDSMQPEFRKGCIIIIDPTGLARDGSYVLARSTETEGEAREETDGYLFRQLRRSASDENWVLVALNEHYPRELTEEDLSGIAGVIVQRAGTRRSYHKHYD
ncbi:MAG: S24 family peptidase [Granulosicoccus sp.]